MKRFNDILCVAARGEGPGSALERAVALAENNQADLTVVDVIERIAADPSVPAGGPTGAELQAAMSKEHEQRLEALVEPYRRRARIATAVLTGVPFLAVVRDVLRNGRDLVIKCADAEDWLDHLLGSDDMHLLRKCPCPVWITKPEPAKSGRRILAAVDVSDAYPPAELATRRGLNLEVLETAASIALSEFGELHVAHVWDAVAEGVMRGGFVNMPKEKVAAYVEQVQRHAEQALDALLRDVGDRLGAEGLGYVEAQTHLIKGRARKEIPVLARNIGADLLVMGTVSRTGIPGFIMGNTAEAILGQVDCSVLAIKPPGFVTPVTLER